MPPPAEGIAARLVLGPALRTQPDRRLVTLVREGYEAAFEEIVRRYGKPLGHYAAAIVGGRSEDVTQDAFSKALLAMRRDDAKIELRPWLFRIVRNTALNDLRDSPPSPEALAEAVAGGSNPAEELERREELADLMRRLRALPEPQRAAIVMRELEGLGHEEIAAALGLSGGAARQAIYRARQALRDGAGMLIPLPLIQALLAGSGPGAAEAAAGAAGIGSAAGAGVAIKATAATVLVAGAVGAGVALDDHQRDGDRASASPAQVRQSTTEDVSVPPAATLPTSGGDRGNGGRGGHGDDDRRGRDWSGSGDRGHGGNDDGSGSGHGGPGPSLETEGGSGRGGPGSGDDSSRSGHGGRGSGSDDRSNSSGSGSGRDGGSESGHGGSGSGHSGSGSGSGGSNDGGGSGSGDSSGSSGSSSGSSGGGSGHDEGSEPSEPPSEVSPEPVTEPPVDDGSGSGDDSGSHGGSGSGSGGPG